MKRKTNFSFVLDPSGRERRGRGFINVGSPWGGGGGTGDKRGSRYLTIDNNNKDNENNNSPSDVVRVLQQRRMPFPPAAFVMSIRKQIRHG